MICLILILSFLLEGVFSNVIEINSALLPCFSLISLAIIYPYFKDKNINFLIASLLTGIFYDIAFTNTPFINSVVFVFCGFIIRWFYKYVNFNFLTQILLTILIVLVNRLTIYLILCVFDYTNFNEDILISSILSSLIANIIYSAIMFYVLHHFCKVKTKKII